MVETWRGIFPITAFVGDALRKKQAAPQFDGLSPDEETLLLVCDFWLAVNTSRLAEYLGTDAVVGLLRAQGAFTRIGAHRLASTLRASIAHLVRTRRPHDLGKVAAQLEDALSRSEEPLEERIAAFAATRLQTGSEWPPDTGPA